MSPPRPLLEPPPPPLLQPPSTSAVGMGGSASFGRFERLIASGRNGEPRGLTRLGRDAPRFAQVFYLYVLLHTVTLVVSVIACDHTK